MDRRLAAVLAADVAGYSRLIGKDEAGTIAALRGHLAAMAPVMAAHGGSIVNTAGDSVLAEFGSVVNAVSCAAALQQLLAERNAETDASRCLRFRIGVNQGEIVHEAGEVYGDGVNVAARLQALAVPGGIAISGRVHEDVAGRLDLRWRDGGKQRLKNIAQPVHVWHCGGAASIEPSGSPLEGTTLPLPDRPSIAVLPFDPGGGDADATLFADGMAEDIITGLARFRALFVVARNSSFAFRGMTVGAAEIGRRLGVAYLLEGSIRRAGTRIRVSAQLVEAATGMHLWAERYDRAFEDIFTVQDEVARVIVSTLIGRIHDASLQRSLRKPPATLAAYECMLRGLAHYSGFGKDDNAKALAMFDRAIELDPYYALAGCYRALALLALNGSAAAPPAVLDAAREAGSKALELDPAESNVYRVLALVELYRRDFVAAERLYQRCLDLNPNDANRLMDFGLVIAARGRHDEALARMHEAMRLNPFQPTWYNVRLAMPLFGLGRYAEAAQALRTIPTPGYWSLARLAACYGALGLASEAAATKAAILAERPDFTMADFMQRDVLLERAEDRQTLLQALRSAGLPE